MRVAGAPLFPTRAPPPLSGAVLAYDPIRRVTLPYGGADGLRENDDTWAFRFDNDAPSEVCTSRVDLDGDGAIGCADSDCWATCTPMCPPTTSCSSSPPRCGDGTCSLIEDCRSCDADCGSCPACGDGLCEGDETLAGCPGDCTP